MKESKTADAYQKIFDESDIATSVLEAPDFKKLFELYWQDLCNYLRSRYGNSGIDAEDVAQAAFTKFAELEQPKTVKNPQAFLFATARNIAIDEFRKAKIRLAHKEDALHTSNEENSDVFSPENVLLERQRLELMNAVIKKLPKIQRTVLLLHRLDKLTYSQIASKYGLSETTVRRHVANAIEKIHKSMKQADTPNK